MCFPFPSSYSLSYFHSPLWLFCTKEVLKTHNTIKYSQSNAIQLLQFHSDLENSNLAVLFFRSLCSSASVHTFLTVLVKANDIKVLHRNSSSITDNASLMMANPLPSIRFVFLSGSQTGKSSHTRCVLVRPKVLSHTPKQLCIRLE